MPVLIGLIAGQIFAAGERPFKVVNTVRVGYSDNLYRSTSTKEAGSFVTDIIDLSFRAALSDRTDVMVKSQLTLLDDSSGSDFYPNLYMMLNHSVSPRLLLRLSEYYRSGEKSGSDVHQSDKNARYNYFNNRIEGSADYVLTGKDRLSGSLSHDILRHDEAINENDTTTVGAGASWSRELSPQRTYATLNLRQSNVTYDNRPKNSTSVTNGIYTNSVTYLGDSASYDQTDISVGLNHTFNQQWQGSVEVGVANVTPNFSDSISGFGNPTNSSTFVTNKVDNNSQLNPILRMGLVYSPSPRTRLTGDLALSHKASDDTGYGGQDTTELAFGAQHDLTAKLMAKATVRFANTKYDAQDNTTGSKAEKTEDRMDAELRLTYKLNRMHFLEAGVKHSEKSSDADGDWTENRMDVGWRVELN
ncbi:MAG: outer membrane beta-barrel protein [Kiritimatiellaceae bacterium]|nr:outer membrane beta-barrel protein [Kiritimatiellaceae bacterium]